MQGANLRKPGNWVRTIWFVLFGFAASGCAAAQTQTSSCDQPASNAISKVDLPGRPFEALATKDGCWIFASLELPSPPTTDDLLAWNRRPGSMPAGIAVLRRKHGVVSLKRVVPLFPPPAGICLTHDGSLLIVTDGPMVAFMDVRRLESGKKGALLGLIRDGTEPGSVYANVTADDRLLFVSDEAAHQVSVIDLEKARHSNFSQSALIGSIPVGLAPVGLAFSKDGRYLFITSELWRIAPSSPQTASGDGAPRSNQQDQPEAKEDTWPFTCKIEGGSSSPETIKARRPEGAITVVNISEAARDPGHAALTNVPAGCSPVRVEVAPAGAHVYVTARNSNALLVFDTRKLLNTPKNALVASVPVGTAPVGLALVDHGGQAVVANSSRFGGSGGQSLTVVDLSQMQARTAPIEGTIPVGSFPRELHTTPDGKTLLLTNFDSMQLELIDLDRLRTILKPVANSAASTKQGSGDSASGKS